MHASAKQHDLSFEPISPELALVDPVLRQRVRSARGAERRRMWAVPADAPPITAAEPPSATSRTWRRHSNPKFLAMVAVAAGTAISILTLLQHEDASTQLPKDPAGGRALVPQREPSHSERRANLTVSPSGQLTWAPVPYATFYNVVLMRHKSRVLDLWPRKAQLSLATLSHRAGSKLRAGKYHWFVYPGFGQRHPRASGPTFYGKLATQGVLTIPGGVSGRLR